MPPLAVPPLAVPPLAVPPPAPKKPLDVDDPPPVPGLATQLPFVHVSPVGQTAPLQSATQVPAMQVVPAVQIVVAHAGSTHSPLVALQLLPVAQGRHEHEVTHTPSSQTWPFPQVTPAQGSRQTPTRHTWLPGQTTPSHGPLQVPASQTWPAGQVTFAQAGAMQ